MWHVLAQDAAPSVPKGRNLAGGVSGGRTRAWAPCHTWEIVFCEYTAGRGETRGVLCRPEVCQALGAWRE